MGGARGHHGRLGTSLAQPFISLWWGGEEEVEAKCGGAAGWGARIGRIALDGT